MPSPTDHVLDLLESDRPNPASLAWLRDGLRRYLSGCGTLSEALGIVGTCPKGLRSAVRTARVNRSIQSAAELLGDHMTTHSRAKLISAELRRLMRVRRPRQPHTWFELHLMRAVESANGDPPTSITRLWEIIAETPVQPDET